jgi:Ni/Co efflux regulator RcnB
MLCVCENKVASTSIETSTASSSAARPRRRPQRRRRGERPRLERRERQIERRARVWHGKMSARAGVEMQHVTERAASGHFKQRSAPQRTSYHFARGSRLRIEHRTHHRHSTHGHMPRLRTFPANLHPTVTGASQPLAPTSSPLPYPRLAFLVPSSSSAAAAR